MVALGLLLLTVAAVIAVVGIFSNAGSGHQLGRSVDLLGYHLQGSTGKLLLVGVILGAVGMLGLNLLLAGLGRGFKRTVSQRQERKQARRQAQSVEQDRDHLASELEHEHAARLRAEQQGAEQQVDLAAGPVPSRGRVGADRQDINMLDDAAERPGAVPEADSSRRF